MPGASTVTLYDPASGPPYTQIIFPITPAQAKATSAAVLYSFSESKLGGISRPRGRKEAQYTFSARLPGVQVSSYPHVHDWQPPQQILDQIDTWANSSIVSQRTRLTLTLSDVSADGDTTQGVTQDVYIGQYDYTYKGALGDAFLDITLTEFRSLAVDLSNSSVTTGSTSSSSSTDTSDSSQAPDPQPSTYSVQPGDSLWEIAQTQMGDGSQWQTLYQANVAALYAADVANGYPTQDPNNPDPTLLFAGTQLTLPGGETAP